MRHILLPAIFLLALLQNCFAGGGLLYKKGGGLGLYLSKIIIRRLSGSIFIDPDYTGGTRMIVILPLK